MQDIRTGTGRTGLGETLAGEVNIVFGQTGAAGERGDDRVTVLSGAVAVVIERGVFFGIHQGRITVSEGAVIAGIGAVERACDDREVLAFDDITGGEDKGVGVEHDRIRAGEEVLNHITGLGQAAEEELIGAIAADEHVRAFATDDDVVAIIAGDDVGVVGADDVFDGNQGIDAAISIHGGPRVEVDSDGRGRAGVIGGILSQAKPSACAYVFTTWRTWGVFQEAMEKAFWTVNGCIVWDKKSVGMGGKHYRPQHEFCLYSAGDQWFGGKDKSDVWAYGRVPANAYEHPTQKSVDLMAHAVTNSTQPGDVIVDPFMGSGSTGVAAVQLGCKFIGIEMDPQVLRGGLQPHFKSAIQNITLCRGRRPLTIIWRRYMTSWPDIINGSSELFGAVLLLTNVVRLHRDKFVQGVHWTPTAFFTAWGLWNLFYYPHLGQWFSFVGGLAIVVVNAIWLGQFVYYVRGRNSGGGAGD